MKGMPLRTFSPGFSLAEALVALALIATVTSAVVPSLAAVARLQRDSSIETVAVLAAASRVARLEADVAADLAGAGGALDTPQAGWHQLLDRSGLSAPAGIAVFDCRWQIQAPGPAGILRITVRVVPLGDASRAVALSTLVLHD
jgi:type II secretory pathway pseudopilin PulG